MIIFWCFPGMLINLILKFTFLTILIVAFVGIISNIYTVCATAPFLAWICTLPSEVVGIISVMSMFSFNFFFILIIGFVFFLKGYFTTCVISSAYDVASYHSPSFGTLWGYTTIYRVRTVIDDTVLYLPSFRKQATLMISCKIQIWNCSFGF